MAYAGELGGLLARGLDTAAEQVRTYQRGLARGTRTLALTPAGTAWSS
ncbi:hypothetical protein [Streptomyces sp. NPDC048266]